MRVPEECQYTAVVALYGWAEMDHLAFDALVREKVKNRVKSGARTESDHKGGDNLNETSEQEEIPVAVPCAGSCRGCGIGATRRRSHSLGGRLSTVRERLCGARLHGATQPAATTLGNVL